MDIFELLRWQWQGYPRYHGSRSNLLIHIAAVPLFVGGNVGLVVAGVTRSALAAAFSVIGIIASLVLQGRGHRLEAVPPAPFTGPINALSRLLLEQWVTFPRFVLSGNWLRALRSSR